MNSHDKLVELLDSSSEPEGVIVHAADGRTFFLTKDEAKRTTIQRSQLHSAFQALQRQSGPSPRPSPKPSRRDPCGWAAHWLATHSPNSARWRRICLTYFEVC